MIFDGIIQAGVVGFYQQVIGLLQAHTFWQVHQVFKVEPQLRLRRKPDQRIAGKCIHHRLAST